MPEGKNKRILYLDDYAIDDDEYHAINEDIEIFGSNNAEIAIRLYDDNQPFDLVSAHLSTPEATDFFDYVRKRDRKILIFVMSALKDDTARIKRFLNDFFPSYDGILFKDNFRETLERTLDRLVTTLRETENQQQRLQNA